MKQFNTGKTKIAIALSGGVDSAVAAKILKDKGHQVIGLFLRLWKYDGEDTGLFKARKVAEFLNIPLYEIEAERKFKEVVVKNFISEYKNLRTPNPCTLCNSEIKFKLLIDKAKELGCEKVATGHYARIENSEITNKYLDSKYSNKKQFNNTAIYHLLAGVDESKDQSYMLYRLTQDQLSRVIFPLGELTKKEVRVLAKKWDLPVAEEKESQEICFLQNTDYRALLKDKIGKSFFKKGDIIDTKGNIVGRHEGLINYTIGQRKGIDQQNPNLKILNPKQIQNTKSEIQNNRYPRLDQESTNKSPLYVIGFNIKKNQLIVGENEEIFKKEMIVANLCWINTPTRYPLPATDLSVKIRSQAKRAKCRIINEETTRLNTDDTKKVIFDEPQRAITPGQSAVYYSGDKVIGGGTIIK
jgi:tRNA-specific 2-thiouridylase